MGQLMIRQLTENLAVPHGEEPDMHRDKLRDIP